MNKKKKLKKSRIIICIISIVIILATLSVWFVSTSVDFVPTGPIYESEQQVFEYFDSEPAENFVYNLDKYSSEISELNASASEQDKLLIEDSKKAKDIPSEYLPFIEKANTLIENFFKEKYSISVMEKLSKIKVYQCNFSSESTGGLTLIESNSIYIPKDLFAPEYLIEADEEFLKDFLYNFYSVYIHEAIHALGIAFETDSLVFLLEGITECLTEDVLTYSGYNYEDLTAYGKCKVLARQFMIADKNFIVDLISLDNVSDNYLNERIDSHSIPGMAENINSALKLSMLTPRYEFDVIAQHLIGEYCKNFDLTNSEQLEIANSFTVMLSEI